MGRYYISADLEGTVGVSTIHQCYPKTDRSGFIQAVKQLTWEITELCKAIKSHDADAVIVVNDAHSTMTNLEWSALPPNVMLISGKPKRWAMMAGLDKTFDAAFLIGYHAKAGTQAGVINHTFHSKLFDVAINGVSYGEGGINAFYASFAANVPVILTSGDVAYRNEITPLLPYAAFVETKSGLSTTAAQHVDQTVLKNSYEAAVAQAFRQKPSWPDMLLKLSRPFQLDITFIDTLCTDVVCLSPLYTRIDGRTVRFETESFETLYLALQSAYTMLAYTESLA